jgi:hypothetical protein
VWQSSYRRLFCIFRSLLPQFLLFIKREGSIDVGISDHMLELPVGLCMHAFPITSERYMYQHGLQRHYLYILITWLFYIFRLRSFVRREGRRRNIMLGQEQKLKNTEFHFASSLNTIRSVLETGPFCANLF